MGWSRAISCSMVCSTDLPASRSALGPLAARPATEITLSPGGLMTQPPGDIFTRRICLRIDGMDAVTVRRDIPYDSHDERLRMDVYYPPQANPETICPC